MNRAHTLLVASLLASSFLASGDSLAQTYMWEGNQNGDGPFICDPHNGEPFVFFYPVSDAWEAGEIRTDDCLLAPSNWSVPIYPNSPTADVMIAGPIAGNTYPPVLRSHVHVANVDILPDAHLILNGGTLSIAATMSNSGLVELLPGSLEGGRISNVETGKIRAAGGSSLGGIVENDGTIELLRAGLPLYLVEVEYSGTGVVESDDQGSGVVGTITVVGGELKFRTGSVVWGSAGLGAPLYAVNKAAIGFEDVTANWGGSSVVANEGTVDVRDGGTLKIGDVGGAVFDNSQGIFNVVGGTAVLGYYGTFIGGTLNGTLQAAGTFKGTLTNQGAIELIPGTTVAFDNVQYLGTGVISAPDGPAGIAGQITVVGGELTFREGSVAWGSAGLGAPLYAVNKAAIGFEDVTANWGGSSVVANEGTVAVRGGATLNIGGIEGAILDNSQGIFNVVGGTAVLGYYGTFIGGTLNGTLQAAGGVIKGTFTNQGAIELMPLGVASVIFDNVQYLGTGVLSAPNGPAGIAGQITVVEGELTFRNGTIGTIVNILNQASMGFENVTVSWGGTVTNEQTVAVRDGATLKIGDVSGATFDNSMGTVNVESGGELTFGRYCRFIGGGDINVAQGGVLVISTSAEGGWGKLHVDGTLSGSILSLDSSTDELLGTGTIEVPIINSRGTVSPGTSPGALHVDASYTQGAQGTISLELGGTQAGLDYDQLLITGHASLGGILRISFLDGFVPNVGDQFDLIRADGGLSGVDSLAIQFSNQPSGFDYLLSQDAGIFSIVVTAVPEPSALVLCIGMAALISATRSRGSAFHAATFSRV